MGNHKPLIGITPGYDFDKNMAYMKDGYYEGIIKAGGIPLLLPLTEDDEVLSELVRRCDGFLASGGPDIDAKYFNEQNLPFNGEISPVRDYMETFIMKSAVDTNKSVFGICRGAQVLNTAMGGTLYQDIYSQIKDRELLKHSQNAPKWYPTHEIDIKSGSRVWKSFLKERVRVNSFHHQAIKDTAPCFETVSWSRDGIIEAIEHKNHKFAVGVQWHPELMWQRDEAFLQLFINFVQSCLE